MSRWWVAEKNMTKEALLGKGINISVWWCLQKGGEAEVDRNMAVSSLEHLWCLGKNSRIGQVLRL